MPFQSKEGVAVEREHPMVRSSLESRLRGCLERPEGPAA